MLFVSLSSQTVAADEAAPDAASAKRRQHGLEKRVPWTTSRLTGTPEPPPPYRAVPAFPKLKFGPLVDLVALPGTDWLVAEELAGKLVAFPNQKETERTEVMVDLAAAVPGFRMAYGIVFHPKFAENRYCYVSYVLADGLPDGTHVSRFTVTSLDPPRIDPKSEKVVLTWLSGGHNGACLQFGLDGMLYVSTGDASSPFPPDVRKTGQNLDDLLACILRIDVDKPEVDRGYRIPADNPFVGREGARGEIWAYGFRNPWKMSIDERRGDLWVGDVGWEMFEMIDRVERGGNYGWSVKEGSQPVLGERPPGPTPIHPPTVEHSHVEARSITGGRVYYGQRLRDLVGAYVYGDFVTGKLWAVRHDGKTVTEQRELCTTPIQIVAFGADAKGELLIVDHPGAIYTLEPTPPADTNRKFPTRLSETGLFASTAKHQPADGVIAYSINAEAWADGATSERFVALPGEGKLGVFDSENVQVGYLKGAWKFPIDGVLAKTVSLALDPARPNDQRRMETQILHYDGRDWHAYAYAWNDQQDDAELVPAEGATRTFTLGGAGADARQRTWRPVARNECILCHTTRAGSLQAFTPAQLNRDQRYGEVVADQLATLTHIGLFESAPATTEATVDPYGQQGSLEERARSYLQLNCGHCHRRGGGGTAAIDLRPGLPLAQTNLLSGRPTQGTFGIHAAQLIAPGKPSHSVLYYRMATLGRGRMPHFGSHEVDERGLRLMGDWIESLGERAAPSTPLKALSADGTTADAVKNAAGELLSTTAGAVELVRALDGERLRPDVKAQAVEAALAHPEPAIRGLFERFLPETKRSLSLATVAKPSELLHLAGDGGRGRALFFEAKGVSCRNCHRVEGKGGEIGPDLTGIGRRLSKAKILEGILEPSRTIAPKFVAWMVETTSGQVQTGLLEKQTAEEVVLKTVENKSLRFRTPEIETIVPQARSLMPELLLRDLKPQEIADLVAFLMESRAK
ncbi:MAG: PQQ-dependent sugar dehydrogenase [Planctomycetaceae bacterium]|nr:PQQ-dependent sugar dehydrogenase [Planctomycetaceae bacterium]